jgi:hypothetical protein
MPMHHHSPPLPPAREDPHFYLSTDGFVLAIVLIWSLLGLWIYLTDREFENGSNPAFCIICGPAAWVVAIWYFAHRRFFAKKPLLPKQEWERPEVDRWKN